MNTKCCVLIFFFKSSIVHSPNLSKNDICPSATLDWMFGKWDKDNGVLIAILIETIIISENLGVNTSLLGMVVVRVDPDADEGKVLIEQNSLILLNKQRRSVRRKTPRIA